MVDKKYKKLHLGFLFDPFYRVTVDMEAVMAEYAASRLPVDEFRGREVIEWDSITECAEFHGVSLEQIKYLVHAGG